MSRKSHVANIGTREKQKRLGFGIFMLIIGIVLVSLLFALGASRWFRLLLLIPLYLAGLGFFQAKEET